MANKYVLLSFVVYLFTRICVVDVGAAHIFEYHGKDGVNRWSTLFEGCGGRRQSAIGLSSAKALPVSFDPFEFVNYNFTPSRSRVLNNGHAVQVFVEHPSKVSTSVKGGGLVGEYELIQYHFHWGENSLIGSEHVIDTTQYPMEMHLVHFKKEYKTPQQAMSYYDGIAVLSVLFEKAAEDNLVLHPIVNNLDRVNLEGREIFIPNKVNLMDLLPDDTVNFFRYGGSLTTPMCQEVVVWTVFTTPILISERQLSQFRKVDGIGNRSIASNFRPIQEVNGRNVFLNRARGQIINCTVPYVCSLIREMLRSAQNGRRFLLFFQNQQ